MLGSKFIERKTHEAWYVISQEDNTYGSRYILANPDLSGTIIFVTGAKLKTEYKLIAFGWEVMKSNKPIPKYYD